jgi:hypothetical protein
VVLASSNGDPQFLHAVLCRLGLPRNPTASRTFERTSGRASLSLQAGRTFDGKKWNDEPLPSGTRPRLVLINLCTQSVRTKSPEVDIGGSVREFLRRLGIDAGGEMRISSYKSCCICRYRKVGVSANEPADTCFET